jgi:hypothetical protein
VRIVINGPPKQGHRWLKCLLAGAYELRVLGGELTPESRPDALAAWIGAGGFADGTIFHQHAKFSRRLVRVLEAAPARLFTVVRDPYDTFVSFYYWAQDRAAHGELGERERPRNSIVGKPLDHPDVLAFLAGGYGQHMDQANGWLHSGRAEVVRYEDLHRDPVATLRRIAARVGTLPEGRIVEAVEDCRAENMRARSAKLARHVRSATVGDSEQHLSEAHLAIFRDRYGDLVRSLGYPVR